MEEKNFTIVLFTVFFVMPAIIPQNALADDEERAYIPPSFVEYKDPTLPEDQESKFKSKFTKKNDLEDRIMEEIPYAKQAKNLWNVVDGDVDIYVKDLRVDRRNKGLVYTTNTMPFIGEIDDTELKFQAGEEMKVSFGTSRIPFVGTLEGFKFKSSVGGDNTKVSFRYTIPLGIKNNH